MFRKAILSDLDRIEEIYNEIHTEEEAGRVFVNWKRGIYPTRYTAKEAICVGDMFVEVVDGVVVASARINKIQVEEYKNINWEYKASDEEIMVIHTLAVSPQMSKKGYGSKFVDFYEKLAKENNCNYLRLDTWENNLIARSLYRKLGYKEVGIVCAEFNGIKGFRLVCLEKSLK